MTPELNQFFSTCRLAKYIKQGETPEQGFSRYQWNLQLGEALLPALSYFELGLRNGTDRAIASVYQKNWLLCLPQQLQLNEKDIEIVQRYKREVEREKGWAPKHDDIVAKLGFGFWSAFYHKRYDPLLWQKDQALAIVFPNMQRALRTRKYVSPKLNSIRKMRNRIAHHEPVWHLTPDTQAIHQTCLEFIHAMAQPAAQALATIDRFSQVYAIGTKQDG